MHLEAASTVCSIMYQRYGFPEMLSGIDIKSMSVSLHVLHLLFVAVFGYDAYS